MMTFNISGNPKGKARPRVTRNGTYTPQSTVDYEERVRLLFRSHCGKSPFLCDTKPAVAMAIQAVFAIPKSYTKRQRVSIETGLVSPTKKPDIDNIAKMILDALNGVAYIDDTQVTHCFVNKRYAFKGELPHVLVVLDGAKARDFSEMVDRMLGGKYYD